MSKFDFNAAETENAGQSAVEQSIYNVKTDGNKARALKATTALAGALAMGLGVAVLAPTHAQADTNAVAEDSTWASSGTPTDGTNDITTASAGDDVNFTADVKLTVTNDGTANDGSDTDDTNTFEIGAVTTGTDGQGTVSIEADAANLAVTIVSVGADANGASTAGDESINALTVTGSNAAANVGGKNATTTITGAAYADTITVTGGNGGNAVDTTQGADGGAAELVLHAGATGSITLDDGNDGTSAVDGDGNTTATGGSGGTATLKIVDEATTPVDQTITGSISAAADGEGAIVINSAGHDISVTGDVGSSTAAIGSITQTSGDALFGGSVYANLYNQTVGAIDVKGDLNVTDFVHADGDITFSGDTAQTVTVVDDANSDGDADTTAGLVSTIGNVTVDNAAGVTFANALTVANGTLAVAANANATFAGAVTATTGDITVADGATATFGSDTTATAGKIVASGTGTTVISNALTLTTGAASTFAATSTLQLNNTLKLGSATSGLTFAADSTLELGITTGTAIDVNGNAGVVTNTGAITIVAANGMQDGNQVILVNDTGGLSADDVTITDGRLMDFTITDDTTNTNVVLTATSKSDAEVAEALGLSEDNAERLLAAFNNSTNSGFTNFVGDANTTDEQIALVNDQVAVQEETLSATAGAISGASAQVATITADRLASLRTGDAYGLDAEQAATGFATGDGEMNRNMWGKLFFNTASQDSVDEAAGYDSDTNGFVLGSDTEVGANMRVGGSLAITRSDIDGKGGGDAQTDVDGYQLTVYGDLTQSDYFVDWQVGASMSNVETVTEIDPASTLNSGSNSEYDTLSYLAKVGMGVPMDMGEGARLTPYGSFAFQRITSDEYSLIFPDDPGLNQTVAPDDVDELSATLGGRYTVAIETEDGGMISPQLRGALSYNFIGNTAEATSTYADGTELTVQGVEAEKLGGSLGAGITYASDATTFGFDIDSTLKDGYASYTGALNFRLQF